MGMLQSIFEDEKMVLAPGGCSRPEELQDAQKDHNAAKADVWKRIPMLACTS